MVLCTEDSLHIVNLRNLELLCIVGEQSRNPSGLCALSPSSDNCWLAYPASERSGDVVLFDAHPQRIVCSPSNCLWVRYAVVVLRAWVHCSSADYWSATWTNSCSDRSARSTRTSTRWPRSRSTFKARAWPPRPAPEPSSASSPYPTDSASLSSAAASLGAPARLPCPLSSLHLRRLLTL